MFSRNPFRYLTEVGRLINSIRLVPDNGVLDTSAVDVLIPGDQVYTDERYRDVVKEYPEPGWHSVVRIENKENRASIAWSTLAHGVTGNVYTLARAKWCAMSDKEKALHELSDGRFIYIRSSGRGTQPYPAFLFSRYRKNDVRNW